MKKFIPLFLLFFFVALLVSFSDASSVSDELRADPQQAFTCGQTVSDSRTFSDEPSRLLWHISAGGLVGTDDVTFFYKDGSPIEAAGGSDCAGFTSPSDLKCSKACAGTESIPWKTYFQDSGAASPDSVIMSGTAYETYQPTGLITYVGFNGWQMSVIWNDCGAGQRVDNGQCVAITGSVAPDKTSCIAPCDVNLTWDTNSYQTATITKNGFDLTTVTTTSGVANTNVSGGPIPDNDLAAGTYNYCIEGNYAGPGNQPVAVSGNLDCKTVTVSAPSLPTADLVVNGEVDDDITVTAGGNTSYNWFSTNATAGSSTLTISPSSPDPCGNTNSSNWVITGTSGNIPSDPTCSSAGGYAYTITYTVTGPGGSASDTVIIRVVSAAKAAISLNGPFTFNTVVGSNPSNQTLIVSNAGTTTLNWTGTRTAAADWLTLGTTSGSVTAGSFQNVTLSVTSNLLAVGTYTATITITDPNASNSPQTASVTLNVTPASTPTADLVINGDIDDDVTITPGGNGSYVWTSTNAISGSSALSVTPLSPDPCGNTNSNGWVITGTSGNLSGATCSTAGGYAYTITYTVTGPGGSASDTVIIRLSTTPVTGASLNLSPNPMNLSTSGATTGNFNLVFSGIAVGISVNGVVDTITVPIGTNITYIWSSYNASSGKADLQIKDAGGNNISQDPCGNISGQFPFISGTSGSLSSIVAPCQAGYTYVVTYTAENTALQSNNASMTVRVSIPTVSLTINKSSFNFNDPYNLAMSTSPSVGLDRPVQLCSSFVPGPGSTGTAYSNVCTDFNYATNSGGGFNWTGTFNSTDIIGAWTEWVNVQLVSGQTVRSNDVNFTISVPAPTASLSISPSSVVAGGSVTYTWSSTNAISGTSTLSITPSSPDPCGNTNSNNWTITGTSGSFSAGTASCQAGYTYTVIYTVRNASGQTAQSIKSVSVTAPPTPSISFLSPSSIVAGQNITVNIYGSSFVGPMTVIWSGPVSGSGCCYSYTANTVSFFVAGNFPAGNYTIQVRNGDGRTSNGATLIVTAPTPIASLSLSGCTRVGCGFTLMLTSNQFSKPFILCSSKNGMTNPCTGTLFTNSSGGYSWSGTFDSSTVGNWEEWVTFTSIGYSSPHIFFTISP